MRTLRSPPVIAVLAWSGSMSTLLPHFFFLDKCPSEALRKTKQSISWDDKRYYFTRTSYNMFAGGRLG